MAVKITEFYNRYRSETIAVVMLAQVFASSCAGALAWFLWQYAGLEPLSAFTYSLVALIAVQVAVTPVVVSFVSRPVKILWQAISRVSSDSAQTELPNVTLPQYEANGLRAMVDTIYDLATAAKPGGPVDATSSEAGLYRALLKAYQWVLSRSTNALTLYILMRSRRFTRAVMLCP